MFDLGMIFPLIGVIGLFFWWFGRQVYILRPLLWVFVATHRPDRSCHDRGMVDGRDRTPAVDCVESLADGGRGLAHFARRPGLSLVRDVRAAVCAVVCAVYLFAQHDQIQQGPEALDEELHSCVAA